MYKLVKLLQINASVFNQDGSEVRLVQVTIQAKLQMHQLIHQLFFILMNRLIYHTLQPALVMKF